MDVALLPGEPPFLFDGIERELYPAVRRRHAERCCWPIAEAAKLQLAELAQLHTALKAQHSRSRWRRALPFASEREAMRVSRACLLNRLHRNIIGGLLTLLLGKSPRICLSSFRNMDAVVVTLPLAPT